MSLQKSNWVPGLDLVRFSAALLVAWYHLAFLPNAPTVPSEVIAILGPGQGIPALSVTAWFGWIGVEIFFVMSGFVIALSSENQGALRFLKGRFLRLYPAVWICATLTLLIELTARPLAGLVAPYLHSVTLYPNFPYIDVVYWTLGVEMAFYAVVFVMLLLGRRAWIARSFFVLGLASTIFWALWIVEEWAGLRILHSVPQRLLQLSLLQHGCFFAIGGILWLRKQRPAKGFETALLALFVATALVEIGFHTRSSETGGPIVVPALIWLGFLILMAISVFRPMQVRSDRVAYAIRLAGLMTYPLYLLHQVCGATLMFWLRQAAVGPVSSLAITLCAMIGLAAIVAALLEPGCRRYAERLMVMFGAMAHRRFARAS